MCSASRKLNSPFLSSYVDGQNEGTWEGKTREQAQASWRMAAGMNNKRLKCFPPL